MKLMKWLSTTLGMLLIAGTVYGAPIYGTIEFRRDTSANWTAVNPILNQGEPGFEYDTYRLKVGDGLTSWTLLPYLGNIYGYSTSTPVLATGSQTIQLPTGLAFAPNQTINIQNTANSTQYMVATVTSYSSTTGVMVFNATSATGSSWVMTAANNTYNTYTINADSYDITSAVWGSGTQTGNVTLSGLTVGWVYTWSFTPTVTGQVPTITATSGAGSTTIPTVVSGTKESVTFTATSTTAVFTFTNTATSTWGTGTTMALAINPPATWVAYVAGGPQGPAGPPNTLSIGNVTTVAYGGAATASIVGSSPNQTLNIGLPVGAPGATGPAWPTVSTISGSGTLSALTFGDANTIKNMNCSVACTLPLPVASTYTSGTSIDFFSTGAGAVTLDVGSGNNWWNSSLVGRYVVIGSKTKVWTDGIYYYISPVFVQLAYYANNLLSAGSSTTWVSLNSTLSTLVPASTRAISGWMQTSTTTEYGYIANEATPSGALSTGYGVQSFGNGASSIGSPFRIQLLTPQTIYYLVNGGSLYITLTGFEL